eukprot:g13952.t1
MPAGLVLPCSSSQAVNILHSYHDSCRPLLQSVVDHLAKHSSFGPRVRSRLSSSITCPAGSLALPRSSFPHTCTTPPLQAAITTKLVPTAGKPERQAAGSPPQSTTTCNSNTHGLLEAGEVRVACTPAAGPGPKSMKM